MYLLKKLATFLTYKTQKPNRRARHKLNRGSSFLSQEQDKQFLSISTYDPMHRTKLQKKLPGVEMARRLSMQDTGEQTKQPQSSSTEQDHAFHIDKRNIYFSVQIINTNFAKHMQSSHQLDFSLLRFSLAPMPRRMVSAQREGCDELVGIKTSLSHSSRRALTLWG